MSCLFDDVSYLTHEYLYSKYGYVQRKIIGTLGSGIFGGSFETRGEAYVLKGYVYVVFLTVSRFSYSFLIEKKEVMGYSSFSTFSSFYDSYVNCCGTDRKVRELSLFSSTSYFNSIMISQAKKGFSLALSALDLSSKDIYGSRVNSTCIFIGKWDDCICDKFSYSASFSCSGRINNTISSLYFRYGNNDIIPNPCSLDNLQSCCVNTVYSLDKIKKIIGG